MWRAFDTRKRLSDICKRGDPIKVYAVWIKIIIGLVGILIIFSGYCFFYGSPWDRHAFSKQVTQYISSKYPDIIIKKQQIKYDYKQMQFNSAVRTDQDVEFHIIVNYGGTLQDDFYSSIWNTRITNELDLLVKQYDNGASARFVIEGLSNDEMTKYKNELSHELKASSKIFIYFSGEFSNSDDELEESFKVIKGIKSKGYGGKVVIFFQERPIIYIDYHQLQSINNAQDIKKHIKF